MHKCDSLPFLLPPNWFVPQKVANLIKRLSMLAVKDPNILWALHPFNFSLKLSFPTYNTTAGVFIRWFSDGRLITATDAAVSFCCETSILFGILVTSCFAHLYPVAEHSLHLPHLFAASLPCLCGDTGIHKLSIQHCNETNNSDLQVTCLLYFLSYQPTPISSVCEIIKTANKKSHFFPLQFSYRVAVKISNIAVTISCCESNINIWNNSIVFYFAHYASQLYRHSQ